MNTFKFNYINSGFCQVHFKTRVKQKDGSNPWIYYCVMEENDTDCNLYRTSKDGEPSYVCEGNFKNIQFESFPECGRLGENVKNWINNNSSGFKN